MDGDPETQDAFIMRFMNFTDVEDIPTIVSFAEKHKWEIDPALADWNEQQANADLDAAENDAGTTNAPQQQESDAYTGPRTLGGAPAPESQRPVKSKPTKKKGIATLGSMAGSSSHQHDHDDDDDEKEDDGRGDLYAGGEKSGLSVQDPKTGPARASGHKKIIQDILAKARQNGEQGHDHDHEEQAGPSRSAFNGSGQKLGNEGDAPTNTEATSAQQPASTEPPQERTLHLWQNGFSIDNGELRRFDDPENARELQMIQHGRAPLHLMNLRLDQAVNVVVKQHDEEFRQPARVYRSFAGEGRRLGSPVPGAESGAGVSSIAQTVATSAATAPSTSATPTSTVDESQPTLTIRIQLPDGTRLPARFNTTNTVGDVYEFVQRASAATQERGWVLATTFPNKDHNDKGLVLGEMSEFKRGGTAVVKWT